MKIAVLSDIHGNFQALESVMKDVEKNNCEKVLCLGDLAMAGPQPRAIIDYVKKHSEREQPQTSSMHRYNHVPRVKTERHSNIAHRRIVIAQKVNDILKHDRTYKLANIMAQFQHCCQTKR